MSHPVSRRLVLAHSGMVLGGAALGLLTGSARSQTPSSARAGMIRLIANENAYGPSPAAREVLVAAIDDSWQYAMRQSGALKKLIAEAEGVSPQHIIIGAGSAEILRITALMYGMDRGSVIAARPTFTYLTEFSQTLGCTLRAVPLDSEMRHDLEAMAKAIAADARLMYFCNPNNPTGTLIPGTLLRDFLATVSRDVPVLVDEAYLDLSDDLREHTAVPRVLAGDRVIVTRTFSKLHGMAGLRIGYGIASPEIVERMENFRFTVLNLPGLRAATASYQDREFLQFSRARIQEGMRLTANLLDELGLPYAPSRGNFVFFDTGGSPRDFMAAMRQRGILTGRSFAPYDSWARVSMGTVEQMHEFAAAARAYFQA